MLSTWSSCVILYLFICSFKLTAPENELIRKIRENRFLPLLRKLRCLTPTVNNGKVIITHYDSVSTSIKISCNENYELRGINISRCEYDVDYWFPHIPKCIHKCGQPIKDVLIPFVVNGTYAKFGDFPWHVAIYQTTEIVPEQEYICGGSIISENCVLTAAHCFSDSKGELLNTKEFFIAAGKYYRSYNSELDKFAQKRMVAKMIIHPDYKGILTNYGWDIAVVVADEPFEISNIVHPVCVDWTNSFENEQLVDNNYGQVAGWGATETHLQTSSSELKKLSVPFVNRAQCLRHVPSDFFRYVTYDKICAGYVNGSSICNGDSGGGLVFKRTENQETAYYIRGLVSLGVQSEATCDSYKYSTYTKVSTHMTFIQDSMTSSQTETSVTLRNTLFKPKLGTLSVNVRNPLTHKNIRLLPSGKKCEYLKNTYENKILYSYPWSVLLLYIKNGEEMGFRCTGVLISDKYVLTAAHCTIGQIIEQFGDLARVRVGEEIANKCVNYFREIICKYIHVEKIIRHHGYVALNRYDDIALLRLESSAIFTSFLIRVPTKPLCLPLNIKENDNKKSTFVYGWDNTNLEHDSWFKFLNTTNQESCSETETKLAQNQKCKTIRENICNVVEGGIVVNEYMEPAYEFYLEGIVFSRPRCYTNGSEIEYTNISDYILWILDNMKL